MNEEYIAEVLQKAERDDRTPPRARSERGLCLYREVVQKGQRAKFISPIREPVSRNVSAFFHNFVANKNYTDINSMVESFLKEYPHDVPLKWFQREPARTLNVDVYAHEFPRNQGYTVIKQGPFEILLLKITLEDYVKEKVMADFLGLNNVQLVSKNVGHEKGYAESYRIFKDRVTLPYDYIERMCTSRYAQHFFSADEIEQVYSRWT